MFLKNLVLSTSKAAELACKEGTRALRPVAIGERQPIEGLPEQLRHIGQQARNASEPADIFCGRPNLCSKDRGEGRRHRRQFKEDAIKYAVVATIR
jgi:hypothetical protein